MRYKFRRVLVNITVCKANMLLLVKCYDNKMVKLPRCSSCRNYYIQLTNKKKSENSGIQFLSSFLQKCKKARLISVLQRQTKNTILPFHKNTHSLGQFLTFLPKTIYKSVILYLRKDNKPSFNTRAVFFMATKLVNNFRANKGHQRGGDARGYKP